MIPDWNLKYGAMIDINKRSPATAPQDLQHRIMATNASFSHLRTMIQSASGRLDKMERKHRMERQVRLRVSRLTAFCITVH